MITLSHIVHICFSFKALIILTIIVFSGSSPQYSVSTHSQAQYTGTYSPPPPEPVDFSGLPRPIGVEYLGSLGSSSYSRESTPSTGSSHFMEGYKDFNGMRYYHHKNV